MYLRMINKKAKWEEDKNKNIDNISSDIITNCLKTKDETLSLWHIENDKVVDDAIIALSSNRDFLNKLDYIIIPDDFITKFELNLKNCKGESPYENFNANHYDITNIDYCCLGKISEMILSLINTNISKIQRVYEDEIQQKLSKAINEGKLNTKLMSEDLLKKIS